LTLLFQTRLIAALLFLVMLTSTVIYFRAASNLAETIRTNDIVAEIVQRVFDLNILTTEHLNLRSKRSLQQWEQSHASLTNILLKSAHDLDTNRLTALNRIRRDLVNIRKLFFRIIILEKRQAPTSEQLINGVKSQLNITAHEIVSEASGLRRRLVYELANEREKVNELLLWTATSLLLVMLATGFWFQRQLLRPITALKKHTEALTDGDFDARTTVRGKGEITDLSIAFNYLAETISQKIHALNVALGAAEASNKELEAFSYSVSHDLRSPLRSLDGFSKAILEDYEDKLDETGRDYLKRIRLAATRMGGLIDDLLKLSKIAKQDLQVGSVNLSDLAAEILEDLKQANPDQTIKFTITPALKASGDKKLLRIALENLLENSVKYSSTKDVAEIEMGQTIVPGRGRCFYVQDHGVGFNMAFKDKLFATFQRLHHTREFPGTGVGLSIVERIIKRHGGSIWAESEVNEGATFYFLL